MGLHSRRLHRHHAWLDQLTKECALEFAADQGYDLKDYIHGGFVADWWGFTWMILAEARGVLTPEKRAAARCWRDKNGDATNVQIGAMR